jgi:ribosomal protein L19
MRPLGLQARLFSAATDDVPEATIATGDHDFDDDSEF